MLCYCLLKEVEMVISDAGRLDTPLAHNDGSRVDNHDVVVIHRPTCVGAARHC